MQSIFQQTWQDFEVIVLDDCSTDSSREIIEQYRNHPQVKAIVYNEVNSGSPFKQWAKGLQLASTEWVWIAESDDYCAEGFLNSVLPGMKDPLCCLAYTGAIWVNEKDQLLKPVDIDKEGFTNGTAFIATKMLHQNTLVNAGMAVFRRTTALQSKIDWSSMTQSGDYALFCAVLSSGKVYCNGENLAYFNRHSNTVSAMHLETVRTTREMLLIWNHMIQENIIGLKDLRKALKSHLIAMVVVKPTLSRWEATPFFTLMIEFGKQHNLSISIFEIKLSCFKLKFRHFFKSSFLSLIR